MKIERILLILAFMVGSIGQLAVFGQVPSFQIDYDHNQFIKDGKPYQFISGSIDYFRVPRIYWKDRFLKAKAAGLSAITTYVAWNLHQPEPDRFDFDGAADLPEYLRLAKKLNLDVILRPGPYICAEWEHGGLPWWILRHKDIRIRTSDEQYLKYVRDWFSKLLPKMAPFLYRNGGPIIMVQVENEYGSFYSCEHEYMVYLRDLIIEFLGNETVLFTTDGPSVGMLKCGTVSGVYATVDFGPSTKDSMRKNFVEQRKFSPKGPLVNSEYYTTWLDIFGKPWNNGNVNSIVRSIKDMYKAGASFSFYMFHGGTNFGYWASGFHPNISELSYFSSTTTSYDYGAPVTESGGLREPMYSRIRSTIAELTGTKLTEPLPSSGPVEAFREVKMNLLGNMFDLLSVLSESESVVHSAMYPLNAIELSHPYGFILYQHITTASGSILAVPGIGDRGYVFVADRFQGILIRSKTHDLNIVARPGTTLSILVENQGRQNYWRGDVENDFKGITSNVTIDGNILTNWTMFPLSLENIFNAKLPLKKGAVNKRTTDSSRGFIPSFYLGTFTAPTIADTFLDSTGWDKGQLLMNGQNIGRYWSSLGPQMTLYVPKSVLNDENTVLMFELEKPGNCDEETHTSCRTNLVDSPIIRDPTES